MLPAVGALDEAVQRCRYRLERNEGPCIDPRSGGRGVISASHYAIRGEHSVSCRRIVEAVSCLGHFQRESYSFPAQEAGRCRDVVP